jgi:Protein of unknown function (DUF2844)
MGHRRYGMCRQLLTMASASNLLETGCMKLRSFRQAGLLLILIAITVWDGRARASLGGDAASILEDANELHGAVQSSARPHYEVREIATDNGMQVREFLTLDGRVFAVSWAGPALPDLQRLLGPHFQVYAAALAARAHLGLHRSLRVATTDLIVESDGQLRSYVGRAYLPAMVPLSVSITDLR